MFLLQQHLPTSTEPARPSRNLAPPPTRNVPCLLRFGGMSYSELVSWVIVPPGGPSWEGHEDAGIHVWHLAEQLPNLPVQKKLPGERPRFGSRARFSQLWQHIFKLKKKKLLRQLSWQQLIFKDEERCGCCSKKNRVVESAGSFGSRLSDANHSFRWKKQTGMNSALLCTKNKNINMICLIKIVQENIKRFAHETSAVLSDRWSGAQKTLVTWWIAPTGAALGPCCS